MYRNRRRRGNNDQGITGPNSALTQFLREEGISAETIRQRWLETNGINTEEVVKEEVEEKVEEVVVVKRETKKNTIKSKRKTEFSDESSDELSSEDDGAQYRRRLNIISKDSDEEEYEDDDTSVASSLIQSPPRKSARLNPNDPNVLKRQQEVLKTRKRRRVRAVNILNKKTFSVPSLQYLCITNISKNILRIQMESEENETDNSPSVIYSRVRKTLGGISLDNLTNLSNALSKNRSLNDQTLQLFLRTDLQSLTFHDCSKISFDGYKSLAIFSPNISHLSLQMCGQLNNESLLYIAEKLPNLISLKLDGPFLINEDTWKEFFQAMKGRLQEFHISNTHRFNDSSLQSLLTNCASSLVSLGFSRLDTLSNYSLLPQYLNNKEFHTLSIQYPYNEQDVDDEVIINLLGQVGSTIKHINLNGCQNLTDSVLLNGFCALLNGNKGIESLSFSELDQITDDGLIYFFSQVSLPNLKDCNLQRCLKIGDMAIMELVLNEAKSSLLHLNLNSLKELSSAVFEAMSFPNLETLNIGFIPCIDDATIETIQKQNEKLKIIEVFGDNKISATAEVKKGVTLIGRQSDNI
ncbi:hypothetical protein TPHA_0O00510 [Tetrapisispora phaffii CBS 4417]|uniref:DNA repair protein RAD7 n=1 Tax=Tetrapisispora phaffii (strain ATCC 24235 / CBS 4417 / NBRC 1672 / NRRL Y-8282 / UCD 70-5) TaxID=1071381 RepID=G8C1J3_TETPH|nr:hypothetical protein TPHA_0O00510 [Tetrapisispora phaffii CBS 4417]CCE66021.1 hypothetical protein TPHA_0O00510 [Tetrapisispora phaffii CBS 4417]